MRSMAPSVEEMVPRVRAPPSGKLSHRVWLVRRLLSALLGSSARKKLARISRGRSRLDAPCMVRENKGRDDEISYFSFSKKLLY